MVITLNLEHLEELAKLKAYAERKNITIDEIIDKAVIKLASKLNDPQKEVKEVKEDHKVFMQEGILTFDQKKPSYILNEYIKDKLKFKYVITKEGKIFCQQYTKLKELNICIDHETEDFYVYLFKAGAPATFDPKYSLKINLEEYYNYIYGEHTFEKYALRNVMKKVEESQKNWKKLNKKK